MQELIAAHNKYIAKGYVDSLDFSQEYETLATKAWDDTRDSPLVYAWVCHYLRERYEHKTR